MSYAKQFEKLRKLSGKLADEALKLGMNPDHIAVGLPSEFWLSYPIAAGATILDERISPEEWRNAHSQSFRYGGILYINLPFSPEFKRLMERKS